MTQTHCPSASPSTRQTPAHDGVDSALRQAIAVEAGPVPTDLFEAIRAHLVSRQG